MSEFTSFSVYRSFRDYGCVNDFNTLEEARGFYDAHLLEPYLSCIRLTGFSVALGVIIILEETGLTN